MLHAWLKICPITGDPGEAPWDRKGTKPHRRGRQGTPAPRSAAPPEGARSTRSRDEEVRARTGHGGVTEKRGPAREDVAGGSAKDRSPCSKRRPVPPHQEFLPQQIIVTRVFGNRCQQQSTYGVARVTWRPDRTHAKISMLTKPPTKKLKDNSIGVMQEGDLAAHAAPKETPPARYVACSPRDTKARAQLNRVWCIVTGECSRGAWARDRSTRGDRRG